MRILEHDVSSALYMVPTLYDSSSDTFSDTSSSSATSDEDIVMSETDHSKEAFYQSEKIGLTYSSDDKSVVLHPVLSAYVRRYPDYDVFSQETLINNGYVECGAGDFTPYTSALSPLDTSTFPILSLPISRDD